MFGEGWMNFPSFLFVYSLFLFNRLEDTSGDFSAGSSLSGDSPAILSAPGDISHLRLLLQAQQSQLQAAVRSSVEAESQKVHAVQLQRMQDIAQQCIKDERILQHTLTRVFFL